MGKCGDAQTLDAALELLHMSEERYRIAAENSSEIIFEYDVRENSIYHVTDRVELIYGVPQMIDNAPEHLVECGAVCPESEELFLDIFAKIRDGQPSGEGIIRTKAADGSLLWDSMILTSIFDDEHRPIRAVGILRNITGQREAELRYENEALFHDAMRKDSIFSYEADLSNHRVVGGQQKWLELLGVPFTDDYDKIFDELCDRLIYHKDRVAFQTALSVENLLSEFAMGKTKIEFESRRMLEDGEISWVSCSVHLLKDSQSGSVKAFFYIQDINQVKQKELDLQKKAERDLLTGLYNKGTTELRISNILGDIQAEERGICAFFIVDLDDFKAVNDQLGHAFGDAVLSETAHSLRSICRRGDIAGRIGGDEFVLFLKNLPDVQAAEQKAEKLCSVFRDAYAGILKDYKVSGTIGVSLAPTDGSTFDELYRKADVALYSAKRRGKDRWGLYSDAINRKGVKSDAPASIDRSTGKTFSENVIEYVFRILYESRDLRLAIGAILELVAKHFSCCRGYIYEMMDDDCCQNTFEWCSAGIKPLSKELKTLAGAELSDYKERFSTGGLFLASLEDSTNPKIREMLEMRGNKAQVQYVLLSNGEFNGFIGFDKDDNEQTTITDDFSALQVIAQMLDVFLSQKKSMDGLARSERLLQIVSDKQDVCTYIIDPVSFTLRFVNNRATELFAGAVPGTFCYQKIRGRSTPCDDCPITRMRNRGVKSDQAEIYNEEKELWFKVNSSLMELGDGIECGLINSHDITEYKQREEGYIVNANAFTSATSLYDALCRSTNNYIYMCNMPQNLFYFPKEMVEEFCLPSELVVDAAHIWAARIHEGEREEFIEAFQALLDGKTNIHCQDYRALNKEGKWVWLRCRGYLEHSDSGEPSLFAGVISHLPVFG